MNPQYIPPYRVLPTTGGNQNFQNVPLTGPPTNTILNQNGQSVAPPNLPSSIKPSGMQSPFSRSAGSPSLNVSNTSYAPPGNVQFTEKQNSQFALGRGPPTQFSSQFSGNPEILSNIPLPGQQFPPNINTANQTPHFNGQSVQNNNIISGPPSSMSNSLSHPPQLTNQKPIPQSQSQFESSVSGPPRMQNVLLTGQGSPMLSSGQAPPLGQPPQISTQAPLPSNQGPSLQQPPLPNQAPLLAGQVPPLPGQPSHFPGQAPHLPGQAPPVSSHGPSLPGQIPMNINRQPPGPNHIPPLPGQMTSQFPPSQGMNRMPPLPNPVTSNQTPGLPPGPPLPGQFPPPGGQYGGGQHNLVNQMQGMNLNGPKSGILNQGYGNAPVAQGYPSTTQMGGGYPQPSYPQSGYTQQQQKRLDPDSIPSPVQVMEDDQKTRSGPFVTNQKGLVPPLVTTNFTVQDQGNASPRFIRSTMYNVPITQDMMKQTTLPFSLVISPMAKLDEKEYPPPIVNFGGLGPVRCIRCKAYMCPYMQFIDSGRRFQCLFCKATTDVPQEYFQHLDHTGQRMDKYERPELVLGTYEFVATADYCRNNVLPKPPAIIFVIDVSYNNIKSGLVSLICSQMKEILQNLPIDQGHEKSNMKVGFITYNSSVHFYNIKSTLAAPQMMVVGDTQDMFMPLLDGFLCTPEESESVIDALMEQIPVMFADTKETEIVLLPAIVAGLEALKASDCTGKLMVFHSTLPTAEAPGKLKNREDRKLLGTDKERTILNPQTQAYNQLGQDCVGAGCSVDLFVFNNSYIDLSTISQVSRLTGGEIFKYTYFQADVDGNRLIKDIIMDISRPIAFDAIMRVRTSTGVRPTDFYGYFYMSNTTDMELAAVDCDKGIAVEIKHDDKLSEDEGVYIQAALLYTSCSGQRRLRILNLSLKTCSQMAELYRSCDLDTIINYIAKQSTYKLLDHSPKAIKDSIVNRAAQILAVYRKNCATPSSAGQLILPECLKLLPLYVNCLLKSDALSGGSDMTVDDRAFAMQYVLTMDVATSVNYFYPRLIPIHDIDASKDTEIPTSIRCTIEKMNEQGVYILENGIHMFLWVGLGANPEFVQNVFGAPSAIQVDIERPHLPELDNPVSIAVRNLIDEIRLLRHKCMRLTIVRQREKLEPVFKHFLVEDRGSDGSASYVDFLCHMHKEIRNLLS
ncbi:COPII coat complex component secretory 24CD [Rhynchophorus ferrugineus]|uniref:COPII coat complex component secretory 24CD n=1 Tax=Rhynchophorus ferrugineus TaxID=354439 RepID=UPI003FCC48CD